MQQSLSRRLIPALVALSASLIGPNWGFAQTPFRPPLRVAQQPAAPAGGAATQPAAGTPAGQPGRPGADGAQQWRQSGPPVTIAPKAPFKLTAEQEKQVDDALQTWEQKSEKINTFKCQFDRWDYDTTFGDPALKYLKAEGHGEIKYKAPDHGKYRVTNMADVVLKPAAQPGEPAQSERVDRDAKELEHWVCDGDSIYEYAPKDKQLIQHKLPPEMRGKSISEGPLPFIFGAKADQIKRRYFVRLITPAQLENTEVWLEAWPRYQIDAANFQRVWIILSAADFVPQAMQIFLPGELKAPLNSSRTAYRFDKQIINDPFVILKGDFLAPITPIGWKKVVQEPGNDSPPPTASPAPPAAAAPQEQPSQARRPGPAVRR